MGWTLRSDDGSKAVLDMGPWGSAIFKKAPAGMLDSAAAAPAEGGRGRGGPGTVAGESFGFAIDQWKAAKGGAPPKGRGPKPFADHDGKGFESFWVKDPDGWPLQICNGNGLVKARTTPAKATLAVPAPFAPTGWKTVWLDHLSFNVTNYKESASFY